MGSFTTAVIYRSQSKSSYILDAKGKAARSRCAKCDHVLYVKDLFPIFSWLSQRGKCRYCASEISIFYPLIEIISAITAVMIFLLFSITEALLILISMPFWIAFLYRVLFDKTFDMKLFLKAFFISAFILIGLFVI